MKEDATMVQAKHPPSGFPSCFIIALRFEKLDISQSINFVFHVLAFMRSSVFGLVLVSLAIFSSCVLPLCLGAGGPTAPGELGVHLYSNSL